MIDRAFYCYFLGDVVLSTMLMKRSYGHNSHTLNKMLTKGILLMALRITAVYEATSYFSTQHLKTRCQPVLARMEDAPGKSELLEKINEF